MAHATLADVSLTGEWIDLTATHAGLVSTAAEIQAAGNGAIAIVWGGASAPTNKSGRVLRAGEVATGSAANVWAKALGHSGVASVTLTA